jgi:hypothetical protein
MHVPRRGVRLVLACALGFGSALAVTTVMTSAPAWGASSGGADTQCGPGYYSSTGDEPCTPAPAGTYVDTTGATSATDCALGTFSATAGQSSCTEAPAGTYVDTTGATSATDCALGTYGPNAGETSCLPAPINTYVDSTGATAPTPCPAGTHTTGTGSTSASDCLPPPPTITRFGPASGPAGTVVTIKGTNLAGATKVTFGGVTGSIVSDIATKLKVKVPLGARTGKIKVLTPGGHAKSASAFRVT